MKNLRFIYLVKIKIVKESEYGDQQGDFVFDGRAKRSDEHESFIVPPSCLLA